MVNTTRTVIHDEHTNDTITLKNTRLPINKGERILIRNCNKQRIEGSVVKIHNIIAIWEDEIHYSQEIHIYVY